jgi:two-component system phosphate regulon response regulator OmpR
MPENTVPAPLTILIVEDDRLFLKALVAIFKHLGHSVRGVGDGVAMDQALNETPADCVLLDSGLPGENGISLAHRLRQNCNCMIIILSGSQLTPEQAATADLAFVKPVHPMDLHKAILEFFNGKQRNPKEKLDNGTYSGN